MNETINKRTWFFPVIIFVLASSFYLYEFILQIAPGVITHELMRDFKIQAAGLGILSACYYYAYTPMQICGGLLYDKFGPRLVLGAATLVCAIGALAFAATTQLVSAGAGRFLMGAGSAFAFVGVLVLVSRWFPLKYFAFLAGITQLMGSLGAIVGESPLAIAVHHFGWRESLTFLGYMGVILAILIWLVVRDRPGNTQTSNKHHAFIGWIPTLRAVLGKQQTWIIAVYAFLVWAPITVFAALWGVPYLMALYKINAAVAAGAVSMVWLGIGIGSPVLGWWSDIILRRKLPLATCAVIGLISFIFVLYVPGIPLSVMYILLFLFGIAASGQSISFAVVTDINHPQVAGTAIGFNNMAVVAGGALFQPLVGVILHLTWHGEFNNGIPIYTVENYQNALTIIPVCYGLAWLVSRFFLKETNCKAHFN